MFLSYKRVKQRQQTQTECKYTITFRDAQMDDQLMDILAANPKAKAEASGGGTQVQSWVRWCVCVCVCVCARLSLTKQIAGVALLGDGSELIETPGVATVAVPRVLHHLTDGKKRRRREEEKMTDEELKRIKNNSEL